VRGMEWSIWQLNSRDRTDGFTGATIAWNGPSAMFLDFVSGEFMAGKMMFPPDAA